MFNIDDLAQNSFSIDFNKITLTNKSGKTYSGAGNIFQNSAGNLELKMYTYDEEGYKLFGGRNKLKAGKIVPNNHYFRFEAYDIFETKWTSSRINFKYELSSNFKNLILRAPVYYLSRKLKTAIKFNRPQFIVRFKKNIKFPSTNYLDKKAKSYENINNIYRVGLIANFIHGNYEFLFYETEYWYIAKIFPLKGRLNEKLINYLCESLQFILSANIYWVVLEKLEGNIDKIQIKEIRNPTSSRIPSPISLNAPKVEDIWELFKKYFDFVNKTGLSDHHQISSKLHNLIQASSGSIESQALSVTTLIENVMVTEISKFYKSQNKFEKDKNYLIKHLNGNKYTNEFSNRIKGFLPRLMELNVKNVFNFLIESRILNDSDLETWNKLRNPVSHGKRIEFTEYQKYLTMCYRCQKIFNILIFLIIGYEGIYSDLGKYGFPTKKFKKSIISCSN